MNDKNEDVLAGNVIDFVEGIVLSQTVAVMHRSFRNLVPLVMHVILKIVVC